MVIERTKEIRTFCSSRRGHPPVQLVLRHGACVHHLTVKLLLLHLLQLVLELFVVERVGRVGALRDGLVDLLADVVLVAEVLPIDPGERQSFDSPIITHRQKVRVKAGREEHTSSDPLCPPSSHRVSPS